MSIGIQQRWGLIVRVIYAACLRGATVTHDHIVMRYGLLWDYGGVPITSAVFWTSHTSLDPMAPVLLIMRQNEGVVATATVIIADVAHNLWITARYTGPHNFFAAVTSDPSIVAKVLSKFENDFKIL